MSALTVDRERLYGTTDAQVWAEEFHKVEPGVDVGLMIGWFANAMATAEKHAGTWWPGKHPVTVRCAFCTQPHDFSRDQVVWLLETMSSEDLEDGPRCLHELLGEA